ncbi:MAG: glycosyltransferase family 4 protein [Candidatus Omnitrophica bacterium]|nr:glycosyltransferase family 4 protein [Candidatus Omnitrophota bacterium]
MKVLFIVPYPKEGPSYRYRVEQFIPFLEQNGVKCRVSSFMSSDFYNYLYRQKKRDTLKLLYYFLQGTARRVLDLFRAEAADLIFVHLEAFPIGPPVLEWLWTRLKKPIVFDLDDAIFMKKKVGSNNRLVNFLKYPAKIPGIIKLSSQVTVCNDYLKQYAAQYIPEDRIHVIPTSIDIGQFGIKKDLAKGDPLTIGWIGSHTTAPYLDLLRGVFEALSKKYDFVLKIVGAGRDFQIPGVKIINREWNLGRDVEEFQSLDIGVYPLPSDEWIKGKTGFKTCQYLSVGVPCVVSNLGRNREIIQDGVNGFLALDEQEWVNKLSLLIEDKDMRKRFAQAGRKTVRERFSVDVNAPRLLAVLRQAYNEHRR